MQAKDKTYLIYLIFALTVLASVFLILRTSELVKLDQIISYSYYPYQTVKKFISNITKSSSVELPEYVRGLYLSAYSAGRDDFRQQIISNMTDGQYLNTVVIDIKDSFGNVFYDSQLKTVKELDAIIPHLFELDKILNDFHQAGIFVVARQVVFQDPILAKGKPELALKTKNGNIWYNDQGLAWSDPGNQEVWEYNLAIAKEAAALGFNEINFDYIRYPSDGPMSSLNYNLPDGRSKTDVLKDFYNFAALELKNKAVFSIDMFGLVLDRTKDNSDMNIGQLLIDAVDYVDYVCPMVYPSHYPVSYLGFSNPALYPFEVISYGLKVSAPTLENKKAKLRPWLQAFNLGAVYDKAMVVSEIEAVESATTTAGWLLWNARNYYPDYLFIK